MRFSEKLPYTPGKKDKPRKTAKTHKRLFIEYNETRIAIVLFPYKSGTKLTKCRLFEALAMKEDSAQFANYSIGHEHKVMVL